MFKIYDFTTRKEKKYTFNTREDACKKFIEIAKNYCEKHPKLAKEIEEDYDHYREFDCDFTKFLEYMCFDEKNFIDIVIYEKD